MTTSPVAGWAVKPGMTGLWQVSGRSRLSWDESIGFDLEYVDNWSPATDAATWSARSGPSSRRTARSDAPRPDG